MIHGIEDNGLETTWSAGPGERPQKGSTIDKITGYLMFSALRVVLFGFTFRIQSPWSVFK